MTHCTSTIVAFRFVCSAGNATFTTVPSMNAMLEASVVAASTQRPANLEQGAAAGRERIMLSSHGSWRTGNIRRFLTRFFGRSRVWNVHRVSYPIGSTFACTSSGTHTQAARAGSGWNRITAPVPSKMKIARTMSCVN